MTEIFPEQYSCPHVLPFTLNWPLQVWFQSTYVRADLIRQETTSLGIGTLVHIEHFLQNIAVKRKLALQNTKRHRGSLKDLVRSYALARPSTRIQLKIIGSKEKDAELDYTPPRIGAPSMSGAALVLYGRALVSSCVSVRWPDPVSTEAETHDYAVDAFILRVDWQSDELASTVHQCQYIAVDSRPISHRRGIGKEIVQMYKESLKDAAGGQIQLASPFIALNIACPAQSYDVNIEPAKDDVAFTNPAKVRSLLAEMFRQVYVVAHAATDDLDHQESFPGQKSCHRVEAGGPRTARPGDHDTTCKRQDLASSSRNSRVSRSAAPKDEASLRASTLSVIQSESEPDIDEEYEHRNLRRRRRHLRAASDEEGQERLPSPTLPQPQPNLEKNERLSRTITNPWTLAKLQNVSNLRGPQPDSSDPIVPSLVGGGQPRMPPTPLSQQKPPQQPSTGSHQRYFNVPSSPSPSKKPLRMLDEPTDTAFGVPASPVTHTGLSQMRSQPRQRQLNFEPALQNQRQADQGCNSSLNGCVSSRPNHLINSQRTTKPESSPGITLNDIPDIRYCPRRQVQHGASTTCRPFMRRTDEEMDTGTSPSQGTRRQGRALRQRHAQPSQIRVVNPAFATTPVDVALFSSDGQSGVSTYNVCQSDVNAQAHISGNCATELEPPAQRTPHTLNAPANPSSTGSGLLEYRPDLSCNRLSLELVATIASIWAASAGLDRLQTLALRQEDEPEPDSMSFLESTDHDVQRWDATVRRLVRAHAIPSDDLDNFDLDIEGALSRLC